MELQNGKIRLFRSVGYEELFALLYDGHVHGRYNCSTEELTTCNLNKVCCFFNEYTIWKSEDHRYLICIDVDPSKISETGDAIWYVHKNFEESRKVRAKKGPVKVSLAESYLREYSLDDVFSISVLYKNDPCTNKIGKILKEVNSSHDIKFFVIM